MCFSATASFAAAGVLTGIGGASVLANSSKAHRAFASIPLLFAAQQAAEGTVWMTIGDSRYEALRWLAVRVFTGFAVVVWPTWLPFSLRRIEPNASRKRILTQLFAFGVAFSIVASFFLLRWDPEPKVVGHNLAYSSPMKEHLSTLFLALFCYVIPTLAPFFVSTIRGMRSIGVIFVASLFAAAIVQRYAASSVWCFFAAILSCLMAAVVFRERSQNTLPG